MRKLDMTPQSPGIVQARIYAHLASCHDQHDVDHNRICQRVHLSRDCNSLLRVLLAIEGECRHLRTTFDRRGDGAAVPDV